VLLEYGTTDQEGFLPGCSEPLLLSTPPPNLPPLSLPPPEVKSLTAGGQGSSLVVHSRIHSSEPECTYTIVLVTGRKVVATHSLNCTEPRHSFSDLTPGLYVACVMPDSISVLPHNLQLLERSLAVAANASEVLDATFPACTPLTTLKERQSSWYADPFFILLFTLPGLVLILTLYVIGRQVWKGGGVPWKWDPRATKAAKYFLYTGDNSVSLDAIPSMHDSTTNL